MTPSKAPTFVTPPNFNVFSEVPYDAIYTWESSGSDVSYVDVGNGLVHCPGNSFETTVTTVEASPLTVYLANSYGVSKRKVWSVPMPTGTGSVYNQNYKNIQYKADVSFAGIVTHIGVHVTGLINTYVVDTFLDFEISQGYTRAIFRWDTLLSNYGGAWNITRTFSNIVFTLDFYRGDTLFHTLEVTAPKYTTPTSRYRTSTSTLYLYGAS